MSERKINLEEIFHNNFDCYTNFEDKGNYNDEPAISKDKFKELCLEFGKQLLELAAENARIYEDIQYDECDRDFLIAKLDKQSILNTIKQIVGQIKC